MPHTDPLASSDPPEDERSPSFFEGTTAFNRGAYFLAHERWEEWWIASGRPERGISKALIQLAAAMYHLQRGNRRGCAKLLDSARLILAQNAPSAIGHAAGSLAQAIAKCSDAAVQGGLRPPAPLFNAVAIAERESPAVSPDAFIIERDVPRST